MAMNINSKQEGKPAKNVFMLLGLVYLFLASIVLMETSLKGLGMDVSRVLMEATANPFTGLFIGLLSTSIVQSSTSTTSIIVGMVGANFIEFSNAVPIIMGANIGTTVTNMFVSLVHLRNKNEFERAFAAATVHDFFNILCVIIFLPIQLTTNFLGASAIFLGEAFEKAGGIELANPLTTAAEPYIALIRWLTGSHAVLMLIISVTCLFVALGFMVKTIRLLLRFRIEIFFNTYIFRTELLGFLAGMILTASVHSSSVTTSLIVPLVGAGTLTLRQVFPYTLGANIGTTVTTLMASLATGNVNAVSIAFAHTLFNACGTAVFWPLKIIPITIASNFGKISARHRYLPFVYIGLIFYAIPILLMYFGR